MITQQVTVNSDTNQHLLKTDISSWNKKSRFPLMREKNPLIEILYIKTPTLNGVGLTSSSVRSYFVFGL